MDCEVSCNTLCGNNTPDQYVVHNTRLMTSIPEADSSSYIILSPESCVQQSNNNSSVVQSKKKKVTFSQPVIFCVEKFNQEKFVMAEYTEQEYEEIDFELNELKAEMEVHPESVCYTK